MSDEIEFKKKDMLLIGIMCGICLFTKANMCLYFVAIAIYLLINLLKNKAYKNLVGVTLFGLIGIIIGILPGIIYCIVNNNLSEMIHEYFIVNAIYSNSLYYKYATLSEAFIDYIKKFWYVIIIVLLSTIICKKLNGKLFIFNLLSVLLNVISILIAVRPYSHYNNILLTNIIFLIVFLLNHIVILSCKYHLCSPLILVLTFVMVVASYFTSWPICKSIDYQQFGAVKSVKNVYNKYILHNQDMNLTRKRSILVVGYAPYIYNSLSIIPTEKYFATPIVNRDLYSEPYNSILESIRLKKNGLVVTAFNEEMVSDGYADEVMQELEKTYALVENENNDSHYIFVSK